MVFASRSSPAATDRTSPARDDFSYASLGNLAASELAVDQVRIGDGTSRTGDLRRRVCATSGVPPVQRPAVQLPDA